MYFFRILIINFFINFFIYLFIYFVMKIASLSKKLLFSKKFPLFSFSQAKKTMFNQEYYIENFKKVIENTGMNYKNFGIYNNHHIKVFK